MRRGYFKYPRAAARALGSVLHPVDRDRTVEEEVGLLILADIWQGISFMRDAWSEKKK